MRAVGTKKRMSDFEFRFGGIARLYGRDGLERLRQAHVAVVGLGGVGSWAVEALARTGIGRLSLIDLDEICVSNVNRQLPALDGTIGRMKADVLAERCRAINPAVEVRAVAQFFTGASADGLFAEGFDFVVDAIDVVNNKVRLIVLCQERKIPMVVCGGAGGRRDSTRVAVTDLALASHDKLLTQVRKQLRTDHGFPPGDQTFGIPSVYSDEPLVYPQADGEICAARMAGQTGAELRLNCDTGFGSASFVTGAFGFAAAGWVVRRLAKASRL